jgi:hypothetical protein
MIIREVRTYQPDCTVSQTTLSLYGSFSLMVRQPLGGLGRLIFRGFTITHSLDTPHSVGLLWTREQLVAETSTWQNTTLTRDRHPCPRRDFFFDIHVTGGIFFSVPFFPFDPFCTFKSFRPSSCHFMIHTSPYTTNTTQTSMPPVGFEPTIPVSERP